jgi:hypothetical protein
MHKYDSFQSNYSIRKTVCNHDLASSVISSSHTERSHCLSYVNKSVSSGKDRSKYENIQSDRKCEQPIPHTRSVCQEVSFSEIRKQK